VSEMTAKYSLEKKLIKHSQMLIDFKASLVLKQPTALS